MSPSIDILTEAEGWSALTDIDGLTRRVIAAAVAASDADIRDGDELSVLLCDDARIRDLNGRFRGIDKATNVLSFPPPDEADDGALGDLAIALETVTHEARDEGKTLADHYAHMVAHGFLHLIGYDHEADDEAEVMEQLERDILARLGIADPYAEDREQPLAP